MAGSSPVSHWCHHVCSVSKGDFPSHAFPWSTFSSLKVDDYLGEHPDVTTLTAMFFFLNFLAATQDIAVDGWALTMLQVHCQGGLNDCNLGQIFTPGCFLAHLRF